MHCPVQHKVKYPNRALAEDAIVNQFGVKKVVPLGSYVCPHCDHWHLTHQYDNRSKRCRELCRLKPKVVKNPRVVQPTGKKALKKIAKKEQNKMLPINERKRVLEQLRNKPASKWLKLKSFILSKVIPK